MPGTRYGTYLQPAFLICVAVLAVAGSSMLVAVKSLGVYLEKEPLPLKKSLELLSEGDLVPYKVISRKIIATEDVIKALGTEDYIQWVLEDTEVPADSAVRKCFLFITYYNVADKRVTHTPDECYMGAGYQRLGSGESVTFKVKKGGDVKKLGGRYVVFSHTGSDRWWHSAKFPILYLFNVNGGYAGSREEARFTINKNLFSRFSYYSKVEWKFYNEKLGQLIYPGKEEAVTASEKLLSAILPILEREHWPDWPVVSVNN